MVTDIIYIPSWGETFPQVQTVAGDSNSKRRALTRLEPVRHSAFVLGAVATLPEEGTYELYIHLTHSSGYTCYIDMMLQ